MTDDGEAFWAAYVSAQSPDPGDNSPFIDDPWGEDQSDDD